MVIYFKMQFYFSFFILGIVIGIFIMFLNIPKTTKIIKYPSPYNTGSIIYRGLSGDCYKVDAEEVKCNDAAIKQPII